MKIITLCAGDNTFSPFSKKPKHLYHVNGKAQILNFIQPFQEIGIGIENFRFVVSDKKPFQKFFEEKKLSSEFVENKKTYKSAIHSLKVGLKGLENSKKPIIITQGDEIMTSEFITQIIDEQNDLVFFRKGTNAPDPIIFKISSRFIDFFTDDKYLNTKFYLKDRDMYATYYRKRNLDIPEQFPFQINKGTAMSFMLIHAILTIEKLFPQHCSALLGNYNRNIMRDLDKVSQTDEYKKSAIKRLLFFLGKVKNM